MLLPLRLTSERLGVHQIDRKRDQLHIPSRQSRMDRAPDEAVARPMRRRCTVHAQGVLRCPLAAQAPEVFQEVSPLCSTAPRLNQSLLIVHQEPTLTKSRMIISLARLACYWSFSVRSYSHAAANSAA